MRKLWWIALLVLAGAALAQQLNYPSVTDARLRNPEPGSWLMWRGDYGQTGYSRLNRINTQNVSRLVPVWAFSTGVTQGHEAAPIVNGDLMFVTTPYNKLFALNARTGNVVWKYERELPKDVGVCCDVVNRGVAVYGDKVYMGTLDAHLIAFEARTGKIVWDTTVADYKLRYAITSAPLALNGKILTGIHGGEYGVRGFVAAYDANTGKELWKTYTTLEDSYPGESWKLGGAPTWLTGSYDPASNTVFWGTGNPAPWMDEARNDKTDLKWSSSVIALNPDTGAIKSGFQYSPNDAWDWDGVNEPILVNLGGTQALLSAHRNGYLYMLNRSGGNLRYMRASPFVRQTGYRSIDANGRPVWNPEGRPDIGKTVNVCPSALGGKNWAPMAFSAQTNLVYVPTLEFCMDIRGAQVNYTAGEFFIGAEFEFKRTPGVNYLGALMALDPLTGRKVWQVNSNAPMFAGVLATAGGLVFTGDMETREFMAFDARSGRKLWSFKTNSGIVGTPMTYEIGGQQYVAVYSGIGGVWPLFGGGLAANLKNVPGGGVLWVFALR